MPAESQNLLNVTVGDGKYTVVQDSAGGLSALRYGDRWRDCCGDNLIYALASEVQELRKSNESMRLELQRLAGVVGEVDADLIEAVLKDNER